jgi:DNA-binding transcriptional regulator YdaS (Cro superfamily)
MGDTKERGIDIAIRLAGDQSALARKLGVKPQTVQKWVTQGKPTPKGCLQIETLYGDACTRAMLDPELFGPINK